MYVSNMQLKKMLNRKDKSTGKEFFRFDITIDPALIKELGWKKGTEIAARVLSGKLVIEKK